MTSIRLWKGVHMIYLLLKAIISRGLAGCAALGWVHEEPLRRGLRQRLMSNLIL